MSTFENCNDNVIISESQDDGYTMVCKRKNKSHSAIAPAQSVKRDEKLAKPIEPKSIVKSAEKERMWFTVYPPMNQCDDTVNGDVDAYAELAKYANEYPNKEEGDVLCEMHFDQAYEDACAEEQRWDDLKEDWRANQNC